MAKIKITPKPVPVSSIKAALIGGKDKSPKLTDEQLSEFANFGGGVGSVDSINNLNKRLLARGFKDNNADFNTSLGAPISSVGFVPFRQANTVIPVIAMNAIKRAKILGIKNVGEFMANADNVISDPKHKAVVSDPRFKQLYPNMMETIAQLYVDRDNEYKPTVKK